MAECVAILPAGEQVTVRGGDGVAYSKYPMVITDPACTSGGLRLYSQAEITALVSAVPGTGSSTPDAALMRETFFMSFGLVIGIWFIGKCVGAVLRLIKGEESEFS